jgi:hypothetical protein
MDFKLIATCSPPSAPILEDMHHYLEGLSDEPDDEDIASLTMRIGLILMMIPPMIPFQ